MFTYKHIYGLVTGAEVSTVLVTFWVGGGGVNLLRRKNFILMVLKIKQLVSGFLGQFSEVLILLVTLD